MGKKKIIILSLVSVIVLLAVITCIWDFTSKPVTTASETNEGRIYIFRASEKLVKPKFTLYENGTFHMTFSVESSYSGIGTYSLENGRLILRTDDGNYIYCFDVVDDGYAFDAEASSDMVWFSDINDGCVFYYTIIKKL